MKIEIDTYAREDDLRAFIRLETLIENRRKRAKEESKP